MSWTNDADTGSRNPPLLTTQSEIEIDIDEKQLRTCFVVVDPLCSGTAQSLELRLDDEDEVTGLQIDDQAMEAGERVRVPGKLTIRLAEPLRPGGAKRLVMKTRRTFRGRVSFAGFPLTHAREQSGAIGLTQGANLWVDAARHKVCAASRPANYRPNSASGPSTNLAFEFLDQPFLLDLERRRVSSTRSS